MPEIERPKITDKLTIDENGKIFQEIPKKNLEARKITLQNKIDRINEQIAALQKERDDIIANMTELNTFIAGVTSAEAAKG